MADLQYKFVDKNDQVTVKTDHNNIVTIYDTITGALLCTLNLPNLNAIFNPTYLFVSGDYIIINYFDENVIVKYNTTANTDIDALTADLMRLGEPQLGAPFETMTINQFTILDFNKQFGRPLLITYDDHSLYLMSRGKFVKTEVTSSAFKYYKAYEKNGGEHLVTVDCDDLELYYIHSRTDISEEIMQLLN